MELFNLRDLNTSNVKVQRKEPGGKHILWNNLNTSNVKVQLTKLLSGMAKDNLFKYIQC